MNQMNTALKPVLDLEPIRFGEFLLEQRVLTAEQHLDALADHWSNGGRIGSAVSRRGFLTQLQVERLAARYHSLDVVEIDG